MIKFVKWVIVLVLLTALVLVGLEEFDKIKADYQHELTSVETVAGKDVVVEIPEDASDRTIAKILKRKGLIRFPLAFMSRLEDEGFEDRLAPGTYTLNTGMNTLDMMRAMEKEAPEEEEIKEQKKLVVPEGFSVDQIAERCEELDICSARDFKNAVRSVTKSNFEFLEDVPLGADVRYKLEGYLFPATYPIDDDTTAASLVEDMLDAFRANYNEEVQALAEERGLNSFQVLNMAAIVERECKKPSERAIIAEVIYNRLREGMLLQIDSTLLYPLTEGLYDHEEVLYDDLEIDSKYNTYVYEGLPVGPICNPGMECIWAVLTPDDNDYLYYHLVNEETGEHAFYETYEEHLDSQEESDSSEE